MTRSTRSSIILRIARSRRFSSRASSCRCWPSSASGSISRQCAATGATAELIYVSPKSGRAVSRSAGEPWRDRMLALPAFLHAEWEKRAGAGELAHAFALTGFFLQRHVLEPRGLSMHEARASFIGAVLRAAA